MIFRLHRAQRRRQANDRMAAAAASAAAPAASSELVHATGPLSRFRAAAAGDMKGAKAKQAGLRLFSRLVAAPSPGREKPASSVAGGALGGIAATLARSQSLGLFQETSPPRGFVVQPLTMPADTEAFASMNGAAAEHVLTPDTKTHWSSTHMGSALGVKFPPKAPTVTAGIRLIFGCEAKPDSEVKPGALEASLPERMTVQVRLAPAKEGGAPSSWVSVINAACVGAGADADAKSAASSDSDDSDDGDKAGEASSAQQEQAGEAASATSSAASVSAVATSSVPDAADRASVAAACVQATFKAPAEPLAPVELVFHQPLRVAAVRIRMRGRYPLPEAASGPFGSVSVKQEHTVVRMQLLELPDERTAPSALSSLGAVRTWLGNAAAAAMAADPSLGTAAAAIQALTDLARASGSLVDLLAVFRALDAAGDAVLPPALSSSVAKLVAAVEATREAACARVSAEELVGRTLSGGSGGAPTWGPLQAKWAKGRGYETSSLTLSDGDTVVRSQSSPTVQVATAGPFTSGRAEWTFLLVEDSTSQCSCFGLATIPITDGNYSGSSQLWMYRAFNGQRYNLGDSTSAPSDLGESSKVQKGQTIRFVLDFEKGSSGEVRAFVQGKDVGVAFTGIRGKSVYPAVQFYSSGREVRIVSVKGPHSAGVPIGEGEVADEGGDSKGSVGPSGTAAAALRQVNRAGRLELVRVAGRQGASARSGDAPGLGAAAGDASTGDGFLPQQDIRAALRNFAGAIFEGTDGLPEVSAKDLALAKKLEADEEQEEAGGGGEAGAAAGETKEDDVQQQDDDAVAQAALDGLNADPFPEAPLRLDQATPALAFAGGHALMATGNPVVPLWGAVGLGGRAPAKPESSSQTAVSAACSSGPELVVAGPDSKALKIARSLALLCPSEAEVASAHGPPPAGGAAEEAEAVAAVLETSDCCADGATEALKARRAAAWGPGARAFAYWTAALDGKYMRFSAQCAVHSKVLKRVDAGADAAANAEAAAGATEDEVASLTSVRVAFELLGDGRVLHRVESAQAAPGELLSAELSASVLGVRRLTVRAWCGSAEHNRVCAVLVNPTALPCTDWICGGWRNDRRSLVCRVHGVRRGEPLPAAAAAAVADEACTAKDAAAVLLDAAGRLAREYAREMRHFGAAHVPDPLPPGARPVSAWPLESPYAVDTSPAALMAAAAALGRARTAAEAGAKAGAASPAAIVARAADLAMACVRRLAVSRVALDEADAVAHASGLALRAAGKAAAEEALASVRAELQAVADSASLADTEAGRAAAEALAVLGAFHGGAGAAPAWEVAARSAGAGGAVVEVELPWPSCVRGVASASTMAFGGALDGCAAAASALPGAAVTVGDAAKEAEADAAAAASTAPDDKKNGGDSDDDGSAELDDLDEDEDASPATGKDATAKADKRRRAMRGAWRKLGSSTMAPTDTAVLFLRAACTARGWSASTAAIWPARAFVFIALPSAADAASVLGDNGLLSAALATVGINDWSPARGSAALASTVRVAARADWPRADSLPTQPKVVVRLYTGAAADVAAVRGSLLGQLGPRK